MEKARNKNKRKRVKIYPFPACSNIVIPQFPQGLIERKGKILSKAYKGRGRPKKTDYEYKSILDLMFDANEIINKRIDNIILSK